MRRTQKGKGSRAVVVALALLFALPFWGVAAQEADPIMGRFAADASTSNMPPECSSEKVDGVGGIGGIDEIVPLFTDGCYHMRSDLNNLDSPQIDVLILVQHSLYAERDVRIMQQVVHMYEAGFQFLAEEEGMEWLADGVDFHVSVDYWDPTGEDGGEFTTYPIVDPEIIIISSNPGTYGAFSGIGIDATASLFGGSSPCHGIANPFDFSLWESLPGFDSHHDGRGGTYREGCDGKGGNVCFAINGAMDVVPGVLHSGLGTNLYDLVAHEVGHCLRLGHVGDAGDHKAAAVPSSDIMSYADRHHRKCVSTLDLEVFAVAMSPYLDVNGDGSIDDADLLYANDREGDGSYRSSPAPFQVQVPRNHYYASQTGEPEDCPQPDEGLLPAAERVEFRPDGLERRQASMAITNIPVGSQFNNEPIKVEGTVTANGVGPKEPQLQATIDDGSDASSGAASFTNLERFTAAIRNDTLDVVVEVKDLGNNSMSTTPSGIYKLHVGPASIESYVQGPVLYSPSTYDPDNGFLDEETQGYSEWDADSDTIHFSIRLDYLATRPEGGAVEPPFIVYVSAHQAVSSVEFQGEDQVPDHKVDAPLIGTPASPGMVRLSAEGAPIVHTSIHDGRWSAKLDLTNTPGGPQTIQATWLDNTGRAVATSSIQMDVYVPPPPPEEPMNGTIDPDSGLDDVGGQKLPLPPVALVGAILLAVAAALRRRIR